MNLQDNGIETESEEESEDVNTSLGRSILRAVNEQSFLSKKVYIMYLNLIITYKNFRLLIFATFKK